MVSGVASGFEAQNEIWVFCQIGVLEWVGSRKWKWNEIPTILFEMGFKYFDLLDAYPLHCMFLGPWVNSEMGNFMSLGAVFSPILALKIIRF